jgi:hypothetical protein
MRDLVATDELVDRVATDPQQLRRRAHIEHVIVARRALVQLP